MASFVDPVRSPTIPIDDVKAHIILMKSFNNLLESIQGGPIPFDPESRIPRPSQRILNYIRNSVHRFHAWINHMTTSPLPDEEPIPPLDVLMIWHAYMLSPSAYHQDSELVYPVMKNLGGMPWDKIVCHSLAINNNNMIIAETRWFFRFCAFTKTLDSSFPLKDKFRGGRRSLRFRSPRILPWIITSRKHHIYLHFPRI